MSDLYKERRIHSRHNVENVNGSISFRKDTNMLNLSIDGAAIETTKMLKIGREYVFKVDHKGMLLKLRCRIVWCTLTRCVKNEPGDVIPIYRAGFMFADGENKQLKAMLKNHFYNYGSNFK